MNRLTDPALNEALVQYPAWTILVRHLTLPGTDPAAANPRDVYDAASDADRDRLVALLYAHSPDGSMLDAAELLGEILALARAGVRPRFLVEINAEMMG